MAETTPQETHVATQKRPLEEPSSPSGPTDQPEAKRPALDKIQKEDDFADSGPDGPDSSMGTHLFADDKPQDEETAVMKTEDKVAEKHEDTVVPDAPTNGSIADTSLPAHPRPSTNGQIDSRATSQPPMPYHQQDESQWLHVRAIISSAEAATVIGKGGENVTQIRRLAGAKCTVSEYTRGAVERILTVSGHVDAVAKAFGLIIRTLNQEPLEEPSTPQSKTYPLRLLIPHILIGSIIGKQGVRIREIQEASGARLNASESCLPLSTERSLVVLGVADAVHIATYYVGSTLVEQLSDRFGGPAASNYAGRHGGPQGVVPGGMQVVPYVPQHAGGQMGGPEPYRKQAGTQPPRTPANPYGTPYVHGQPAQQPPQAAVHYGAGSPRAPYVAAGPAQPQPYGHAGPQPAHAGPPQQPMPGMVPGQPITQQIFIPNDMVGAIIGKGGAKINEIRQLSGSVIKINEPQDNNNERLVTITGTQECNQMALYMLYSRLGESSKNSNSVMPR
jgi:poly(rC)-binding protein 2/3/4